MPSKVLLGELKLTYTQVNFNSSVIFSYAWMLMLCKPIQLPCAVTWSIASTHCKFSAITSPFHSEGFHLPMCSVLIVPKSYSLCHLRVIINLSTRLLPALSILWFGVKTRVLTQPGKRSPFTGPQASFGSVQLWHNCICSICGHKNYQTRSGTFRMLKTDITISNSKYFVYSLTTTEIPSSKWQSLIFLPWSQKLLFVMFYISYSSYFIIMEPHINCFFSFSLMVLRFIMVYHALELHSFGLG